MGIVGLESHLSLLKCCVSAAVTHMLSLHGIALDCIRIGHSCCVCQVELVMTSDSQNRPFSRPCVLIDINASVLCCNSAINVHAIYMLTQYDEWYLVIH